LNIHTYKRYKAKKYLKYERDDIPEITEEEEDEDTEEIIKVLQKNKPKKFFRNIYDESETEQSKADIILIISHQQPNPHLPYNTNYNPTSLPTPSTPYTPPYETNWYGHRILHDDND
jgi:hypothetical protein